MTLTTIIEVSVALNDPERMIASLSLAVMVRSRAITLRKRETRNVGLKRVLRHIPIIVIINYSKMT